MTDEIKYIEKFVILLLGVLDKPIKSELHLQKELFVLSRIQSDLKDLFNFEKHYMGPYAPIITDLVNSPMYYQGSISKDRSSICLSENGKKAYRNIIQEHHDSEKLKQTIFHLKAIREIYDRLDFDELLFLIYDSYPEYKEKSSESERIFSKDMSKSIINSMRRKKIITEQRFLELQEKYVK